MTDPYDLSGQRVLAVDDSPTILALIEGVLEETGSKVTKAASGAEAREAMARPGGFDLILLDLTLPDAAGLDLLKEIRAVDSRVTVVLITGSASVASATEGFAIGSDGYIDKRFLENPDEVEALPYALSQAMARRQGLVAQEQLEEMKRSFFTMVTHDVRGPTGNVALLLQMVLDELGTEVTDQQREFLTLAHQTASEVVDLVTDFLDYSKIEAGYLRVEPEDVDLGALTDRVLGTQRIHARSRGQTLELSRPVEPLRVSVDPGQAGQIITNLVGNAIKYTPEGGKISVDVASEGSDAVIRVKDTGPGIPPDGLASLFAPYQRLPGEQVKTIQGTGLGLTIVKAMVQANGGSVIAESEGMPGRGSTFVVRLPIG